MPAFLVPLIAGAASLAGQWLANKSNKKQANDAQKFSQTMSDTAVQRSVEDYRRAGLNPGLAYDRSASSPVGVMTQMGNLVQPAEESAYNALNYRTRKQEQTMQTQLIQAQMGAAHAANARDTEQANLTEILKRQAVQQFDYMSQLNPTLLTKAQQDLQGQSIDNTLKALMIPGAQNAANLERKMGMWSPGLKFAGQLTGDVMNLGKGAASIVNSLRGKPAPTINNFRLPEAGMVKR